jgi:hypothetical protein
MDCRCGIAPLILDAVHPRKCCVRILQAKYRMVRRNVPYEVLQFVLKSPATSCSFRIFIISINVSQLLPELFLTINFQNCAYAEDARCDVENPLD